MKDLLERCNTVKTCQSCEKIFSQKKTGRTRMYCSPACKQKAYRQKTKDPKFGSKYDKKFGRQALKKSREKQGYTPELVAERLDIPLELYLEYENNKRPVPSVIFMAYILLSDMKKPPVIQGFGLD